MIRRISFFTGAILLVAAITSFAWADEGDREVVITVNQPVAVPGHVLQPGQYDMKFIDTSSDVLRITKRDGSDGFLVPAQLVADRPEPTDAVQIDLAPDRGGPPRIVDWFYPGQKIGIKFEYTQQDLNTLAGESSSAVQSGQ